MAQSSERDDVVDTLTKALFEAEAEDPHKADQMIAHFIEATDPFLQFLGQRLREFMDGRREALAHGTHHGVPLYDVREWSGPVHTQMIYYPDGTAEGHVILPIYPMEQYRQACKYCYTTHGDWWMMDQRDYLIDDVTILLCGRCEYTSAQDHETLQHQFISVTDVMKTNAKKALSIEALKSGAGSGTGKVRAIPRHVFQRRQSN